MVMLIAAAVLLIACIAGAIWAIAQYLIRALNRQLDE
jgi:hypothetical protein